MTYAELLEELKNLRPEQLEYEVLIFNNNHKDYSFTKGFSKFCQDEVFWDDQPVIIS